MVARNLILTLILTIFSIPALAQDKTEIIDAIQKECSVINHDKTLRKVKANSNKHTKLTGFYKGKQLRKITSISHLNRGEELFEYYFQDNKLIFVYEQLSSDLPFVGRYYFANDRMVDYITLGHNRFEDDSIDPQTTLLAEAREYKLMVERCH